MSLKVKDVKKGTNFKRGKKEDTQNESKKCVTSLFRLEKGLFASFGCEK